jgi:hypothetical protein
VARIIGSEGRWNDFSRSFLPLKSFLHARWTKVRDLFLADQIDEAIRICEYGGCYLVRDGNHRVSVAKTHGVEFMDAEVTRYRVSVKLPPAMRRSMIPVFAAKLELQRETQLFNFVPEELLGDGQLRSWAILRTLLAKWLEEQDRANSGAASDTARRAAESFRIFYENTRALMRREAVQLLFAEKSELDIFAEVVAFWMRLGEDATPADALLRFISRTERTRGILSLGHVVSRARRWLLSPPPRRNAFSYRCPGSSPFGRMPPFTRGASAGTGSWGGSSCAGTRRSLRSSSAAFRSTMSSSEAGTTSSTHPPCSSTGLAASRLRSRSSTWVG